jgi:uncharacterized protein (DUF58 family)
MLPIPTRNALFAFAGSAAMLLFALLFGSPTAVIVAAGPLLALALAFALTMPLGARLRRQRLEFAWFLSSEARGQHGAVSGAPFEIRCQLKNRSGRPVHFAELLPVLPPGVQLLAGGGCELTLAPRARSEFQFKLVANAAARIVLQGLAVTVPGPLGLFFAPLYFPSPLSVKVMPRSGALGTSASRSAAGEALERSGLSPLRRRGSGTELYEIREHRPGDSFKSIAWKASARAGTLLVREVEREVQDTLYIVLDISGSMRGGAPGARKLDHCVELAALLAQQALERGDRVGLLSVDGRVVAHVPDGEGLRHMLRIYEALLAASEVVDADLTEIDDDALVGLVARYVRQQEGADVRAEQATPLATLAAHAARALQSEPQHDEIVASTPEHALLRRFCRMRGVALPYRAETRAGAKAEGLAQALRTVTGTTRTPRTVRVLTDFDGVHSLEPILQVVRMLRQRSHGLLFVMPRAESLAAEPTAQLERDLARVYGWLEERRLADARAELGRLGVQVLSYDAREGLPAVVRRADALRRVA